MSARPTIGYVNIGKFIVETLCFLSSFKSLKNLKAPNPVPAIPAVTNGFCVNTSNTLTNPVKALVAVTITSLLAKFPTSDVKALESLFILPSQLFADFSASSAADPVPSEYSLTIFHSHPILKEVQKVDLRDIFDQY